MTGVARSVYKIDADQADGLLPKSITHRRESVLADSPSCALRMRRAPSVQKARQLRRPLNWRAFKYGVEGERKRDSGLRRRVGVRRLPCRASVASPSNESTASRANWQPWKNRPVVATWVGQSSRTAGSGLAWQTLRAPQDHSSLENRHWRNVGWRDAIASWRRPGRDASARPSRGRRTFVCRRRTRYLAAVILTAAGSGSERPHDRGICGAGK